MKEDSDREFEPTKWAKQIVDCFGSGFWAVEFLSKFQPDPTDGSKVTLLFGKHAHDHIASVVAQTKKRQQALSLLQKI